MTKIVSQIIGCGSYLPERIVSNDELATRIETSDEWIRDRTGIRQRHLAADGEVTSDLATVAAQRALEHAGITGEEVDLIIVATTTPDLTFPATAVAVQANLGITQGAAFDLQAVCSGFIYGLSVADNFIKAGQSKTILVIGAETMSRIIDWEDRTTAVLFGDGAGAIVMRADNANGSGNGAQAGSNQQRGVLSTHLHSNGSLAGILCTDGGPSKSQTTGVVTMAGREVFRHAVTNLAGVLVETLDANGLTMQDVDWLIPHQANKRIIDSTIKKLGLPESRVVMTVDRHANTSSASVPLALDEAVRDGRIKSGDLILMEAMGGGLTWGAGLVRW
jgi:3-oxoacyl-[acyl-carrier-protein] synthase-3